MSGEVVVRFKV